MKINCKTALSIRFGRSNAEKAIESVGDSEEKSKIVGGVAAVKNEFPWQARLLRAGQSGR